MGTIPRGNAKRWIVVLASIALVSVLLVPSVGGAAAAPVPTLASSAAGTWAYGGSRWVNESGATPNGSATFSARAFLGVQVLLTQTNTSATTFELTANRTMVADLFVTYCRPDCTKPIGTATLTIRAWEVENATANFTTNGTVTGANGPVPALALLDSAVRVAANVTETETANYTGLLGMPHSASKYVSAHVAARANLQFSPALGLVPNNLTATPQWSSNSSYAGTGAGAVNYTYSYTPFSGTGATGSHTYVVSVNATGNVTLQGSDLGPVLLQGGLATTAVRLTISGPFSVREGFIVLPGQADLFNGAGAWTTQAAGGQSASTNALDYGARGGSHTPIDASATAYAGSSSDLDSATPVAMVGPTDNAGTTTLQAEPESAGNANSQANCYLSSTCIQGGGTPATHSGLGALIVLTVAVVGLTVVVVGLLVARQPPRKDPPSPNANLYPQGAAASTPPSAPAAAPVPPPKDDPLGHLW
jgi:hypothetical protein